MATVCAQKKVKGARVLQFFRTYDLDLVCGFGAEEEEAGAPPDWRPTNQAEKEWGFAKTKAPTPLPLFGHVGLRRDPGAQVNPLRASCGSCNFVRYVAEGGRGDGQGPGGHVAPPAGPQRVRGRAAPGSAAGAVPRPLFEHCLTTAHPNLHHIGRVAVCEHVIVQKHKPCASVTLVTRQQLATLLGPLETSTCTRPTARFCADQLPTQGTA